MKASKLLAIGSIVVGLTISPAVYALEKEHMVELKDVPEAVHKAIKEHAEGGEVLRVEKEMHQGKPVFEALIKKGGKEMAVGFDESGKMVEKSHEEKLEHLKKE